MLNSREENIKSYKNVIESKLNVIQGQQTSMKKFNVASLYNNFKSNILETRYKIYQTDLQNKLNQEKEDF